MLARWCGKPKEIDDVQKYIGAIRFNNTKEDMRYIVNIAKKLFLRCGAAMSRLQAEQTLSTSTVLDKHGQRHCLVCTRRNMRRVYEIYKYIDSIAPFCTAEHWDNPGLLVGDANDEVNKAVICLDMDKGAADFARGAGAQLLISHHPVIFDPLKRLGKEQVVYHLVQNHLAAICAHTNLDCAHDGVSDTLAQRLELANIHVPDDNSRDALFLRCGTLKEAIKPEAFAQYVKEHLACEGLRFVCGTRPCKKCDGLRRGRRQLFKQCDWAESRCLCNRRHQARCGVKRQGRGLYTGGCRAL